MKVGWQCLIVGMLSGYSSLVGLHALEPVEHEMDTQTMYRHGMLSFNKERFERAMHHLSSVLNRKDLADYQRAMALIYLGRLYGRRQDAVFNEEKVLDCLRKASALGVPGLGQTIESERAGFERRKMVLFRAPQPKKQFGIDNDDERGGKSDYSSDSELSFDFDSSAIDIGGVGSDDDSSSDED